MTKKKKKHPQRADPTPLVLPVRAPVLTPRRAAALSIGALCLLWLVQFFGVLTGGAHLWEDVVQGEYPGRYFTRMAFFAGEFPHWNPFTFCGMPFFATGGGFMYPLNAVQALLPVSDAALWRVIQTVIVLHVLIAGLCMFAYLRFKKRTNSASLFGAAAFMLGGYMITHVIHSSIIYIVAWMPLMLILLERGINEMKPRYAVMGGALLGAVMQTGHAQVMFYAIIFMFTYSLYFIVQPRGRFFSSVEDDAQTGGQSSSNSAPAEETGSGRPLLQFKQLLFGRTIITAVFFATGAGLCLVQYLPIFEAGGQTARISYTLQDASEGSLQLVQLLTALMPKLFGAYTGSDSVPVFWLQDAFRHGYYNYWETCFYFGVSTLILSIFIFLKIRTDRSVMFAAGWALLSFMIALGGNFFFYKMLFALGIPGFNSFRATPRILFIWGFLFSVMAAAVLDSLNDLRSKRFKIISLSLCAAAVVLGVITAAGGLTAVFPLMNAGVGRAEYAERQGLILLVNALLFGGVLILFFTDRIKINTAKALIIACLAIDMLVFAAGQHISHRTGADVIFGKAQPTIEQIRRLREEEIFRVNTRQFILRPENKISEQGPSLMERNQGYVSGIEIIEGYNPFRLKYASLPLNAEKFDVWLDLMNVRYYFNPHLRQGDKNVMLRNETMLPRAKLFYKAKVINVDGVDNVDVADSLILNYMDSERYDHRNEVVVTNMEFAKFTGDNGGTGSVKVTKQALNRIELDISTDREAVLWLSEIWYPAWKATVNGEKADVHRANYSFRAVIVPPGRSQVALRFESAAFNMGMMISLLTLIAALVYLLVENFINRKKKAPADA